MAVLSCCQMCYMCTHISHVSPHSFLISAEEQQMNVLPHCTAMKCAMYEYWSTAPAADSDSALTPIAVQGKEY